MSLAVSIVAYQNGEELRETMECVLRSKLDIHLFLIDNSLTDELKKLATDSRVTYIFNNKNLGYGAAHNIALKRSLLTNFDYHLVLNPDITFEPGTLEAILDFMEINRDFGSLMPKIFYDDGTLQRLCKLLPNPFDLIIRRFLSWTSLFDRRNQRYELHNFDYNHILNTPCLSGCFMFIRTDVLKYSGVFDEQFFMYLEDYDLNRRINQYAKVVFYPEVSIIHKYKKGSYLHYNLLRMHIASAIKYFNKWGWWSDHERTYINQQILKTISRRN